MGIEVIYTSIVKATYDKLNSKHYSQWWETESIPLKDQEQGKGVHFHHYYSA